MGGKLRQNGLHLLHVSVRHFGADFFFEKKLRQNGLHLLHVSVRKEILTLICYHC
jgi:hypothetical protein